MSSVGAQSDFKKSSQASVGSVWRLIGYINFTPFTLFTPFTPFMPLNFVGFLFHIALSWETAGAAMLDLDVNFESCKRSKSTTNCRSRGPLSRPMAPNRASFSAIFAMDTRVILAHQLRPTRSEVWKKEKRHPGRTAETEMSLKILSTRDVK